MSIASFIREQPAVFDRCYEAIRKFERSWSVPRCDGIALVGSGSSFNALTVARPRFVAARRGPVVVYEPEDFVAELADRVTNFSVIVLTQSGTSRTSNTAIEAAITAGLATLVVTAAPEQAVHYRGATILHMPVGAEPVGPKTKGFAGSLVMLFGLAETLGAPPAPACSGAVFAAQIEPARQAAEALVAELGDVDALLFAGRRAAFGIALEASLKAAEIAGIPTAAYPTEELLHGRVNGMTQRTVAFIFATNAREAAEAVRVKDAMAKRGCRVLVVDSGGDDWPRLAQPPLPWSALGMLLPFQWLAVRLAEARGLRPEAMRYGGALLDELAIKTEPMP